MAADVLDTDCVAGMRCPMCGSRAPYSVAATCWMTVYEGATELFEDVRWTDDSACMCLVCGHFARVRDFLKDVVAR